MGYFIRMYSLTAIYIVAHRVTKLLILSLENHLVASGIQSVIEPIYTHEIEVSKSGSAIGDDGGESGRR